MSEYINKFLAFFCFIFILVNFRFERLDNVHFLVFEIFVWRV